MRKYDNATMLALILLLSLAPLARADLTVHLIRLPNAGIQPQVQLDNKGTLHVIYFQGKGTGNLFYITSRDFGTTFSKPLQVNSNPNDAIATGNIRGAHLALGKDNRPHVAWNGADKIKIDPAGTQNTPMDNPMWYTRLNDAATAFEPERNLINSHYGLDGGGSLTADSAGNVYVAWHARGETAGEANRKIYLATSADNGKTFNPETTLPTGTTGVCGCCALGIFTPAPNHVLILYRSANEMIHRDMYLLSSTNAGQTFTNKKFSIWESDKCPMSTNDFALAGTTTLVAWEETKRVYFGSVDPKSGDVSAVTLTPERGQNQKYPALAVNKDGKILMAWSEETAWEKGGSAHWQLYDSDHRAIRGQSGKAPGFPIWGLLAAFPLPDGSFAIIY